MSVALLIQLRGLALTIEIKALWAWFSNGMSFEPRSAIVADSTQVATLIQKKNPVAAFRGGEENSGGFLSYRLCSDMNDINREAVKKQRLFELLDYIEQAERLRQKPQLTVPSDPLSLYQADVRGLPGITFALLGDDTEIWMRVERLTPMNPPAPTGDLSQWVSLSAKVAEPPTLRDFIVVERLGDKEPARIERQRFPKLEADFARYLEAWRTWSTTEIERRKTIRIYNDLFALQQRLESEGSEAPLEVAWGIGVAVWGPTGKPRIEYPLLTALVEINVHPLTYALEITPRRTDPVLETAPYAALDLPGVLPLEKAWKATRAAATHMLSPFDSTTFVPTLKNAASFLDPSGRYWPEHAPDAEDKSLPKASTSLTITDSWVIFARKRSANLLIQDLHRLRDSVEAAGTIDGAPAALVTEPLDEVVVPDPVHFHGMAGGEPPQGAEITELYFPKSYNAEQVRIAERLERQSGVIAQGPPGTGKTHTIANLICHALASGKRVLVTSKGETALSVLRDQIPPDIRDLAVSLLTNEREGMKQFEHTIQKVAAEVTRIDPARLEREVRDLRARIDQLQEQLAATDRRIASFATRHLTRVTFGGKSLRPEEIARHVIAHEPSCAWLMDRVPVSREPVFTDSDIQDIRAARMRLGADLVYLRAALPQADDFPDGLGMLRVHQDLLRAHSLDAEIQSGAIEPLVGTGSDIPQKLAELGDLLGAVSNPPTASDAAPWITRLGDIYRRRDATVRPVDLLLADLRALESEREEMMVRPVSLPDRLLDSPVIDGAIVRLSEGRSAFALPVGKTTERAALATIRIAGRPASSAEDWRHVHRYMDYRRHFLSLVHRWNALSTEYGLLAVDTNDPGAPVLLAGYLTLCERVRQLVRDEARVRPFVERLFGAQSSLASASDCDWKQIVHSVTQHQRRLSLSRSWQVFDDIQTRLNGKQGPIVERMQAFLARQVGSSSADTEIQSGWSSLLVELRRVTALRELLTTVDRVSELVRNSGAPNWADTLATIPAAASDPHTPSNWIEAWTWRRAKAYLEEIDGRDELRELQANRSQLDQDLQRTYETYVSKLTWFAVFRNSTPSVRSALQAYLNAIMHIGKGTGIRAVRYRLEARDAMTRAHRAIPCLILPHWRVSETLPAEIGSFDLVIVDEASQSDLWALPCLLRGKQLLVVGDDKQVSPDAVGLEEQKIKDLKNRYLSHQVFGAEMTPEKSIYDLARVVFAGDLIVLREHFRCVEPIISFSNQRFYNSEIRPLRIPKASERIDPPLVDVLVKGGYRAGKNTNPPEARAIVAEIERLVVDPKFAKRTIGVVSLLGSEQAHFVYQLLSERLDPKEIVDHQIVCGDARTFQGRERDIIFLSMVATPETAISATRRDLEQRFNVATSRARDRMYLFRSVERKDLKPEDLKGLLIDHFEKPFLNLPAQVEELRTLCESDFERDLFDELSRHGYRVTPQVAVGAFHIDMVVEGSEDRRLAIECDGDKYHGPDRWAQDAARQRVLERAGWTFWRCFASSYVINRAGCLADLYGTLKRMGIAAIGRADGVRHGYTEHRVIEPESDTASGASTVESTEPTDNAV